MINYYKNTLKMGLVLPSYSLNLHYDNFIDGIVTVSSTDTLTGYITVDTLMGGGGGGGLTDIHTWSLDIYFPWSIHDSVCMHNYNYLLLTFTIIIY